MRSGLLSVIGVLLLGAAARAETATTSAASSRGRARMRPWRRAWLEPSRRHWTVGNGKLSRTDP